MTPEQLKVLVGFGESEILEFKRSTGQRTDAAKSVCAMLNNRGGRVLFGVSADKGLVGQQISDRTIEEVTDELRHIDPPAFPTLERVTLQSGSEVLIVNVMTGRSKPYVLRGIAYRRVGNTNRELSRDEYNGLLLERVHGEQRWENEEAPSFPIDELDEAEIVARHLTERQQQILSLLATDKDGLAFSALLSLLKPKPRNWELKEDLNLLRQLGLAKTRGHARGARWFMA